MGRAANCEACDRPLSIRGDAVTRLCFRCRQDGAAFVRNWINDMRARRVSTVGIAEIVGISPDAVRARASDSHRLAGATTVGSADA